MGAWHKRPFRLCAKEDKNGSQTAAERQAAAGRKTAPSHPDSHAAVIDFQA
jgi:hypothetical protein